MKQTVKKLLLSVLFGAVTGVGCCILGIAGVALAGAGHGSPILGCLFLSPIYKTPDESYVQLGPISWAIVGALLPWAGRWYIKLLAIGLTVFNYWALSHDLKQFEPDSYSLILNHIPEVVLPLVAAYILMQLFIWWKILFPSFRKSSQNPGD